MGRDHRPHAAAGLRCRVRLEQAIDDGVLADVSSMGREVGIVIPVAVTEAVWAEYVKVPDGVVGQDETGRLWDILWVFRVAAAKESNRDSGEMLYTLLVRNDNEVPRDQVRRP